MEYVPETVYCVMKRFGALVQLCSVCWYATAGRSSEWLCYVATLCWQSLTCLQHLSAQSAGALLHFAAKDNDLEPQSLRPWHP